jgi:cytochrome b involved in lipid metabolism
MKYRIIATLGLLAALGAGCASSTPPANQTQTIPDNSKPAVQPGQAAADSGYGAYGKDENGDTPPSSTDQATEANAAYTLDDVAKHASDTDCWLAVDGKVYDVTKTIDKHPGGPTILKGCGKDATEMFNGVEKHGEKARGFLPSLQIGMLKP